MKIKKPKVSVADSGKHMCLDQGGPTKSMKTSVGMFSKRKK